MTSKAPLIAILACVVLAAGFYFLAWQPKAEEQTALEDETAQLEDEAQRLRNEIAALEEIKANEVEIRAAITKLEEYIPEGPAQPAVVRQLQDAADEAGVAIESMSFGEPERVEGAPETGEPGTVLARIESSFDLDGGYFQIVDFLRRIEVDVPRAVLVRDLSLSGGDEYPALSGSWSGDLFAIVPTGEALEPGEGDAADGADGGDGGEDSGGDGGDDGDADDDGDAPEIDDDEELQEAAG